jgi:alcohol dehydrogenase class IV
VITNFYMPTRIVAGAGSLAMIGRLARDLRMSRALVVSDPVISAQSFHAQAQAALADAGEIVIRTEGPRSGTVHVHFPRFGYSAVAAEARP